MTGRIVSSSAVSPELEIAITTSSCVIMPRSPWLASAGCRKKAGVPVLASVAAILLPMWPDLPMPVTTTRPRAVVQQPAGRDEAVAEAVLQRRDRGDLGRQHAPAARQQLVGIESRRAGDAICMAANDSALQSYRSDRRRTLHVDIAEQSAMNAAEVQSLIEAGLPGAQVRVELRRRHAFRSASSSPRSSRASARCSATSSCTARSAR